MLWRTAAPGTCIYHREIRIIIMEYSSMDYGLTRIIKCDWDIGLFILALLTTWLVNLHGILKGVID